MKIQTCLCAVATNVPLSRHVHIDLQSKLIFFHQGFCILIYVKELKNNQFRIILLRRIFLPHPSILYSGQEQIYLHGTFKGLGLLHIFSLVIH